MALIGVATDYNVFHTMTVDAIGFVYKRMQAADGNLLGGVRSSAGVHTPVVSQNLVGK